MEDSKIQELIDKLVQATKKHQSSSLIDWRTANKEANMIHKIFLEVTQGGQIARETLLKLVDSEESDVSLMAAVYSLKYNPEKSLATLRKLAKLPGFTGFQAEQAIKRWEEGSWQLE
jgi:hypothetical protein